jgi:transcriptional regulator with XRE-family HTH domain
MTGITLADRINRRLKALGMNVAEAERLAGVNRTYIADIVAGRKRNVRKLADIARALRTTEAWLLTGMGSEDSVYGRDEPPSAPSHPSVVAIDPDDFTVLASVEDRIIITGIDTHTGNCSYTTLTDKRVRTAQIIDPSLQTVENIYLQSLMRQRPITALLKEKLKGSDVVQTYIVDAA